MMKENSIDKKIKNAKMTKVFLNVCIFFIIFGMAGVAVTAYTKMNNEKKVEPPTPGLSNSIYDSQNNNYESESGMPNTFYIFNGHYAYDMTNAKVAISGSTSFYQLNKFVNVSISSVKTEDGEPFELFIEDMKSAFNVKSVKISEEGKGYRNGWTVEYAQWQVSDEENNGVGVSYVASCDEGYFVVSTFTQLSAYELKDLINVCTKIFDSVRVSDQWIQRNKEETSEMFVPETTTVYDESIQQ